VIAIYRPGSTRPAYFIRLKWEQGRLMQIRDFYYVPYIAEEPMPFLPAKSCLPVMSLCTTMRGSITCCAIACAAGASHGSGWSATLTSVQEGSVDLAERPLSVLWS
jgi:hypothetical protein